MVHRRKKNRGRGKREEKERKMEREVAFRKLLSEKYAEIRVTEKEIKHLEER